MKKIILGLLICSLLSGVSANLIFAEETTTTTLTESFNQNPLSLVGRILARIRIILARDPIKKAELTLQLTQDDLLKLNSSNLNTEALKKALDNYNQAIDRLKTRLENLKETTNNPNIDELLDKLSNLEVAHQEVFDKLVSVSTSTAPLIEQTRNRIQQEIIPLHLRFENQEEFMKRLQESLRNLQATSTPVGELRQLRVMETLRTRLEETNISDLATSTQERLEQLKNRLENQIQQRTETLEKQGFSSSTINQVLEGTSKPIFKTLPSTPPPNSMRGNK